MVDRLEGRHATWIAAYVLSAPTRYLDLAAAAEQARRAQAADRKAENLRNALKAATAKVRAFDDTCPSPHTMPVETDLPEHADAGSARTAVTLGTDASADDGLQF
ncbi:hypothetical protein ABZS66_00010 [Dactylosporangium sp. NPDC005572]|uniref:hypothetical protein n=1 Tax=Dactylosporangium sp. NPDC005572 TaxID=3156889 RepID=UPI0033B17666